MLLGCVAVALINAAACAPASQQQNVLNVLNVLTDSSGSQSRTRRGMCVTCDFAKPKKWWQYFSACQCLPGWEGKCCDEPTVCSAESPRVCARKDLGERSAKCSSVATDKPIRIGGSSLPQNLQGVFWLMDQGDSSSIVSFAASNDGAGISTGVLSPNGDYKIRVGGDRTWSFHDRTNNYNLARAIDLVYKFSFDSPTEPTRAQIHPQALNFWDITLSAEWLLDFTADLYPAGTHELYKESVVWRRSSSVIGIGVEQGNYDLVQVMDVNGEPIQPAYADWVKYCESAETGADNSGTIFYHEA